MNSSNLKYYVAFSFILIATTLISILLFDYFNIPSTIEFGEGSDLLAWLMFLSGIMILVFAFILSIILSILMNFLFIKINRRLSNE